MAKNTNKDEFSKSNANDRKTIIASKEAASDEFWSEPSESDQPFSSFGVTEGSVPNQGHTQSGNKNAPQGSMPEVLAQTHGNAQSFEDPSELSGEEYGDGQADIAFNLTEEAKEQEGEPLKDVVGLSLAAEKASQTHSSFRNNSAIISKKIDLNAPLYPVDDIAQDSSEENDEGQADDTRPNEFHLPQSLEEASIKLGDPNLMIGHNENYDQDRAGNNAIEMNFDGGTDDMSQEASAAPLDENDGPVLTMSEPEIREFSKNDKTQNRTHPSFAKQSYEESSKDPQELSPEKFAQLALAAFSENDEQIGRNNYENTTQTGPEFDPYGEFTAIVESRNTKTREVKLTQEEFSRAEQQILESRQVHISGKVLVLDAVAITKQVPQDGSRRRRRSA